MSKMQRPVHVIGVGMIPFTKPGASAPYTVMGAQAAKLALDDAAVDYRHVQQAYVGYVYGDSTAGQRAVYEVGMSGIPIVNVNNNCSTGSTALFLGRQAVASGAVQRSGTRQVSVQHPQGRIDVEVALNGQGEGARIERAALVRTARKILQGDLHIPHYVFSRPPTGDEPMKHLIAPTLAAAGLEVTTSGTLFVKPFTHGQMQQLVDQGFMTPAMLDGLARLVDWLPELGSELWVHARPATPQESHHG